MTKPEKPTRQIAASLREAQQVADLAGVDVLTMPVKVADEARQKLSGNWKNCVDNDYDVQLNAGVSADEIRLHTLWDVSEAERRFTESLIADVPETAEAVVSRAHDLGVGDLFPRLSEADLARIADDGKIPQHAFWADRIKAGEVGIDTLLNLAGLASFTSDQTALDERIRRLIRK